MGKQISSGSVSMSGSTAATGPAHRRLVVAPPHGWRGAQVAAAAGSAGVVEGGPGDATVDDLELVERALGQAVAVADVDAVAPQGLDGGRDDVAVARQDGGDVVGG